MIPWPLRLPHIIIKSSINFHSIHHFNIWTGHRAHLQRGRRSHHIHPYSSTSTFNNTILLPLFSGRWRHHQLSFTMPQSGMTLHDTCLNLGWYMTLDICLDLGCCYKCPDICHLAIWNVFWVFTLFSGMVLPVVEVVPPPPVMKSMVISWSMSNFLLFWFFRLFWWISRSNSYFNLLI